MFTKYIIYIMECFRQFRSDEWQLIPEEERSEMGMTFDDDGEFWYENLIFSYKRPIITQIILNQYSLTILTDLV